MNAPQKSVPKSKLMEWRGLDAISRVVHGMGCIWREQEKDDIGIDGEIELCKPRADGKGLVGTGRVVKVQSKAGSSYVIKDAVGSFSSPVTEKDLIYWRDANVPVLYVVYHADDEELYWKPVKDYLRDHPEALTAPFRIDFDKSVDRFDSNAYPALCDICEHAPERISTDVGETLYTNMLEVLSLPERVWIAPVLPEKQSRFHERLTGGGVIPPYVYDAGMVTMLSDPGREGTAIGNVVDDGAIEDHALDDWLSLSLDNENRLKALLNGTLHRRLRWLGMDYVKHPRRYFFNKGLAEDAPLRRHWTSSHSGRSQPRLVAKYHEYGKLKFFRHLALDARFERFGRAWSIVLAPMLFYSTDGRTPWEGEAARSYAISSRAKEYNDVYRNNILFWAHLLSDGERSFNLRIAGEPVATVSGLPSMVRASFSIAAAPPPSRRLG